MSLITVELKDGTRRQVEAGSTWGQVAAGIGRKLGKEAYGGQSGRGDRGSAEPGQG